MSVRRIAAVIGTGRSGTTWLGSLLNAHPEIAYRFEPLARSPEGKDLHEIASLLKAGQVPERFEERLYGALIVADPLTDKPPFFEKVGLPNRGVHQLWSVARVASPLRRVYARLFTPTDGRLVIFKEVTSERIMATLLRDTDIPIVYLVRNPFGTVASLVAGQRTGKMPSGRLGVIGEIAEQHDPSLITKYGDPHKLSVEGQNALLWRIDVEHGTDAIADSGRGLLLTYEELCREPMRCLEAVCSEFGLQPHRNMRSFVEELTQPGDPAERRKRRDVRDDYFTVYRNPRDQVDRWKTQLTEAEIDTIRAIVEPSRGYSRLATQGGWLAD